MKQNLKNNNITSIILSFGIIACIYIDNVYEIPYFGKGILLASLIFQLLEIKGEIKIKKMIILIGIYPFFKSIYSGLLISIILIFYNKKKILKKLLLFYIFFFIMTIFLSFLEILPNNILIRYKNGTEIIRNSLGFLHPNLLMLYLFPIISLFLYLYSSRLKKIAVLVSVIVSTIFFYLSYSRTTYYGILAMSILFLINDKYLKKSKNIIVNLGIFLTIASIILPKYLMITNIANRFSGRFYYFNYYLQSEKISFLGEKLKDLAIYPLDNFYLRILFNDGLIGIILFNYILVKIIKRLYEYNDYKAIRILIIILLMGTVETPPLFYSLNIIYYIVPTYFRENFIKIKTNKILRKQQYEKRNFI